MYWTLDTRPPTLDEIIAQGAKRIRAAVDAVCARYDAPQLEVPKVDDGLTPSTYPAITRASVAAYHQRVRALASQQTAMPGSYYEVDPAGMKAELRRIAAQQNVGMFGLGGLADVQRDRAAAQQGALGGLGLSVGCIHDIVIDATGTKVVRKRGPQYHKPESFGTLTEFV